MRYILVILFFFLFVTHVQVEWQWVGRERHINITGQRADISQRLAERVDDWDAGGGTVNGRQMAHCLCRGSWRIS